MGHTFYSPEIKLRPPATREGLVCRERVLDLLQRSRSPVVTILAPPGYGKTTSMSQFQAELKHPSAWLTLDESDSDPTTLILGIADALDSAGLVPDRGGVGVGRDVLTTGVGAIAKAIDPSQDGVLFLDQIDYLQTQAARDVVGAVMTRLGGVLRVFVAARTGDGLPIGLLRAEGKLSEVGVGELAMNRTEAEEVFVAADLSASEYVDDVLRRTEGWPAGIYLTAMAIKAGAPAPDVGGDDVFLADYLRQELLGPVSDDMMSFLLQTSILTRMSGPLCDHVLERTGSAQTLSQLESANLLVVPMDRTRTWYRYHSLLRDYLRSELERSNPEGVARLQTRAGEWFEQEGLVELAADHYLSAGDSDRFAHLVRMSARRVYSLGKVETVMRWLTNLEEDKVIDHHPDLAAIGAFARALEGDAGGSERMAVHAFNTADGSRLEDDQLGPYALMLRSYNAERGVDQSLEDARRARKTLETTDLEWLHPVMGAEALATQAVEGPDAAERIWVDALWRSEAFRASPFTSTALAERALLAVLRDDWPAAEELVSESLGIIHESGLDRYITSTLTYTLAARLATRKGDAEDARAHLARAVLVRPLLTVALPLFAVQNLHEMARAFIELADIAGARRVLRDAADILALRPRLGRFASDHEELRQALSTLPAGSVGASSLTKAELRLLPLLVTHLTYPEIGERLFVSRHTVKTQAMSIYRKLGVSSRGEAVARAREVGLLSV